MKRRKLDWLFILGVLCILASSASTLVPEASRYQPMLYIGLLIGALLLLVISVFAIRRGPHGS
jgi:hypothetical protein